MSRRTGFTWGAIALVPVALLVALSQRTATTPKPRPNEARAWAFPAAARVVAIGDLHGDLSATRRALRLAGAIDARDQWIGGSLVVVQTGDQLDRGDEDREVHDLLERLERAASAAGGLLLALNGNHELMNSAGDFRYVTRRSFESYAPYAPGDPTNLARGRIAAFAPGGPSALVMARRPIVAAVGGTLFAHGGVLSAHVVYGLDRLNREASAWLRGERPELGPQFMSEDSPLWSRLYSDGPPSGSACAQLRDVLQKTGMRRLVVGHTVQPQINSACDGKVWRIDVGMSRHYGGPVQVLEIQGDKPRVLRDTQKVAAEPAHAP